MRITVLRAWPGRYESVAVDLPTGATVSDALAAAGWSPGADHPGLAIFGRSVTPDAPLTEDDRVELLRPLERDPKQARRLREQRAKARGPTAP